MTGSPRALLVDYGGVLTERMSAIHNRFCADSGIERGSLDALLHEWVEQPDTDSPVPALELGTLPIPEFERLLAARLRRHDNRSVAPDGLLDALFSGAGVDVGMLAAIDTIRARGVRTAVVSNAWGSAYPTALLRASFDALVFSNEVGLRKPEPGIYLYAARRLGVDPAQCVFVDDRQRNVDGAVAVGMRGLLFAGAEDATRWLFAQFGVTGEA